MNHKATIGRRETGSLAKEGDREEERLNESQGYNRKERDWLAGKEETEKKRDWMNHKATIGRRETGSLAKRRQRRRETEWITRIQ
jgi:hypothetical protein